MTGAVLLAARAALWLGAGRVYAGLFDTRVAIDPLAPELMLTTPEAVLNLTSAGCLVIGPGLGQSNSAIHAIKSALKTERPLLIDADALNLLAMHPVLLRAIPQRTAATLITPHPGEAARLLGITSQVVQANRISTAHQLHIKTGAITILKGAGTLITNGQTVWQNHTGNPGMAAPGMGDILAGIIAALIAQGLKPLAAAQQGVLLHGLAADTCVEHGIGPRGLTASEVTHTARSLLNGYKWG